MHLYLVCYLIVIVSVFPPIHVPILFQECFRVFEEKVCIADFPARYTPQFWLAHAALTTIYSVMT